MPEETRYFTLNGNVPNGGVPPGRMFASVAGLPSAPNPGPYLFNPGPFTNAYGPPPPYYGPQDNVHGGGYLAYYPTMHPGSPPPGGPPAPHVAAPSPPAPAAPRPTGSPYEPPGQYIDGHMLHGDGWSYIAPSEHTTIHFVSDGSRPCDAPDGYYPHRFDFTKHKVPSMMSVQDLIMGLGAPAGDENGITEMVEMADFRFAVRVNVTQGSEDAKKTLREMGWTQRRSEAAPIWIVVKR